MARTLLSLILRLAWSEYELQCVPTVDYAYMYIQDVMEAFYLAL